MKPLFLEIQAFGPYVEKQTVDFEKISTDGIFLIKGKTGSGKTTVFDAMTFALYGGGSGTDEKSKNGRNSLEEWRSNRAPDNLPTIVSLDFDSHGKKYRFTRKYALARTNFNQTLEAGEIDEDGNVIPFFNNPKELEMKKKAEELIGLTKDQFVQVVLLPQGQFERFLTAPSGEKSVILDKIFNTWVWGKYADAFFNKASEVSRNLEKIKNEADILLSGENAKNITELKERIESLKTELSECEKNHREFNAEEKQKTLNNDISLFEKFKGLHTLETEKSELENIAEVIKGKESELKEAAEAEKLRPFIREYEDSKKNFDTRKNELEKKENNLPAAETAMKTANDNLEKHNLNSKTDSLNAKIGELCAKRADYESIGAAEKDCENAEKAYNEAFGAFNKADKTHEDLKRKAAELLNSYNEAVTIASDYRKRYFEGIYGEIAGTLEENRECPVCGSKTHPSPAKKASDSVSKEETEEKEKKTEVAKRLWDEAEIKRQSAEAEKAEKEKTLKESENKRTEKRTKVEALKKNLIEGIGDLDALNVKIRAFEKEISDYNLEGEKLKKAKTEAENAFTGIKTQIETAKEEKTNAENAFNKAKSELNEALLNSGYPDMETVKGMLCDEEKRRKLLKEITEYRTRCDQNTKSLADKQSELTGLTEPDSMKFSERQNEINTENSNYEKLKTGHENDIKRLNKKSEEISKLTEEYENNKKTAESDIAFAKKLRGESAVGIQRYVQAILFNRVIDAANEMLKKVHGGRYTLFRSDEKGDGNKRGLELKVHDNRSPEKEGRGVAMLSGGEKFLVSLALSIGISGFARNAGVKIETLFIDEGFGTLDENSIADAMEVLENVKNLNCMIGIISHVKLLEDTITKQLEVKEGKPGNIIKIV